MCSNVYIHYIMINVFKVASSTSQVWVLVLIFVIFLSKVHDLDIEKSWTSAYCLNVCEVSIHIYNIM